MWAPARPLLLVLQTRCHQGAWLEEGPPQPSKHRGPMQPGRCSGVRQAVQLTGDALDRVWQRHAADGAGPSAISSTIHSWGTEQPHGVPAGRAWVQMDQLMEAVTQTCSHGASLQTVWHSKPTGSALAAAAALAQGGCRQQPSIVPAADWTTSINISSDPAAAGQLRP